MANSGKLSGPPREIAAARVFSFGTLPEWLHVFLLSTVVSHGSLLAFWAALGGRPTPYRLVVAVVGVVLWMQFLAPMEEGPGTDLVFWVLIAFTQMSFLSALLLAARFFGAELTGTPAGEDREPSPRDGRWEQFSLGSLLSWTAAVAVFLGAVHYLPKEGFLYLFLEQDIRLVVIAILAGGSVIALCSIWLTLATRRTVTRCVLLLVAAAAAVAVLIVPLGWEEMDVFLIFCLCQVFWVAGSLWLVRLAGYRLIWRRRVRL